MMQSTIRFTRRIMTLLLAVVMLFGTLITTADAANRDNVQHYDTYMCIGDSIAAGFYIDGQRAGYYRTRMPGAYHDIIANATDAKLNQFGWSAFRAVELRYMLEGKRNEPDNVWLNSFPGLVNNELLDVAITGARGILFNVTGGADMTLFEVNEAMEYVTAHTHPDLNVVFGTIVEPTLSGTVRATLVATDFVDSADAYRTPKVRTGQPGNARRSQSMMKPAAAQQQNRRAASKPSEPPPQPKTPELTLPDFIQRRRTEIPPLTMHMDDGTTIPPFRPKG